VRNEVVHWDLSPIDNGSVEADTSVVRMSARDRHPVRITTNPDTPPPQLFCPTCQRPLLYRHTVHGGVVPPERWDMFECRHCGQCDYRHRTRTLRVLSA